MSTPRRAGSPPNRCSVGSTSCSGTTRSTSRPASRPRAGGTSVTRSPLLPFPDLRGKRCLDIGTWDGFYAYEMERRGAAEVVAIDLPDLTNLDYPPEVRVDATFDPGHADVQQRSAGFRLLHDVLGSKVQWRGCSIYDVADAGLGTFDFVDARQPARPPARPRAGTRRRPPGDRRPVHLRRLHPRAGAGLSFGRRPMFELRGIGSDFQWWMASDRGLRQLLHIGGFEIERMSPFFLLRPGEYGRSLLADHGSKGVRALATRTVNRVLARTTTRREGTCTAGTSRAALRDLSLLGAVAVGVGSRPLRTIAIGVRDTIADVTPERPLVDVAVVEADPVLDRAVAPETLYLRRAGDAAGNAVALLVVGHLVRASGSAKCGRSGRGPTIDMSPFSTLNSCGSSSMLVRRSRRPKAAGTRRARARTCRRRGRPGTSGTCTS